MKETRIVFRIEKDKKEKLKEVLAEKGHTLSDFFTSVVEKEIKKK